LAQDAERGLRHSGLSEDRDAFLKQTPQGKPVADCLSHRVQKVLA
jgi:hypothetical protein